MRLKRFLKSNTLQSAWKSFDMDYTHEIEINGISHTSTIDHIIWNEHFSKNITKAGVIHSPDNTSDHSPIFCNTNLTYEKNVPPNESVKKKDYNLNNLKLDDWLKYKNILEDKLKDVNVPHCIKYRNVHCKNDEHVVEIDAYATEILYAVDQSIKRIAKKSVKLKSHSKIVPGWNDEVKEYREEAMFWNAIWTSAGKPMNNMLHNKMKRTRNIYHYQIRKCKRAVDIIKKNKLLDACVNGNGDIFSELRKMRNVRRKIPEVMDGNKNVSVRFREVYQSLYNSGNDRSSTESMLTAVNKEINTTSLHDVDLVTADIVKQATDNIKLHKNDPIFEFNSDCMKLAPLSLFQHLTILIKSFLIHGHVSKVLLISTLVPLLKDKLGDTESSDNYRSIALSSIILKMLDWIILILFW